jgi:class 3 adenylate cyclase/tetratricopeptide (TPR) repeat protein
VPLCSKCGQDNPDIARFCLACGTELAPAESERREVRKVVTVLFADVTGSTALGERLDPESLRHVMSRYFDAMRAVIERHGGTVEKFIGDAVMAVFGIPVLHEDDALRALRAAAEATTALSDLNEELSRDYGTILEARIGVNTGEVVTGTEERLATGDAVNVAARLEQSAEPGEVLVGQGTYRLARDAVVVEPVEPLTLKGKSDLVAAYRLVSVTPGVEGVIRRQDSPLVGRTGELELLRQAMERVIREQGCHLFTVLGPAGIGKTRMVEEFLASLGEGAAMIRGRCLPYGEGITYWPVAEAIRGVAGITDDDRPEAARAKVEALVAGESDAPRIVEQVAGVLGLTSGSGAADEVPWAVRKLLEAVARNRPAVVVIDDAHWAETALLDLVEHIADWTRDAPILLFCLARQELLDQRPGWGGGKVNATSILLEALSLEETEELVANLLGEATLDESSKRRIAEASEGNPLFAEQLVAMLIDDGTLRRNNGRWLPSTDLSTVSVPPTIQALLSARLDRLGTEERQVMERASVIGRVFYPGAVIELSPDPARAGILGHLMTLVRKELIRPDRTTFGGEEAMRFRHLFVRDAAYEAMPKQIRAELHERFAKWLEAAAGARAVEYEEILGYHLEQAYRYRTELGPLDDESRRLGEDAAERLIASGRRAQARGDVRATSNLLGRAVELLPANAPERGPILVDLAVATAESGGYASTYRLLDEAIESATSVGDRATETSARLELAFVRLTGEGAPQIEFASVAERAVETFTALGGDRRLARALFLQGLVRFWVGSSAEGQVSVELAMDRARSAGDQRTMEDALSWFSVLVLFGHIPVDEGERRAREMEAEAGSKYAQSFIGGILAYVEASRGNFDEARRHIGVWEETVRDLGMEVHLAAAHPFAEIYRHWGGWQDIVDRLGPGMERLDRMGEKGYLSTTAAYLAEALYHLGRYDEAERHTMRTRDDSAADDVSPQSMWRTIQAMILARRGEFEEAERLGREGVEIAEATDYHPLRGDAKLNLAEVYRLAGRTDDARTAALEAAERYELKGNRVLAERARSFIAGLGEE